MWLKKVIQFLVIVLVLISCKPSNTSQIDSVEGNWKSLKLPEGNKFHTEIFIDSSTMNVFSEEVNDIIFSNYYATDKNKIYILERNKLDTLFALEYSLKDDILKLSGDVFNTHYLEVHKGKTLKDYINGSAEKAGYIKDFYKRKE